MTTPQLFSRETSLRLEPVESMEQINELSRLADIIWHEYYLPILGPDQVTYMLENIQSRANLEEDIETGKLDYFLIKSEGQSAGYLAIQLQDDKLFISKRTVEKHRANLMEKTGCTNTASLVMFAVKNRLFEL